MKRLFSIILFRSTSLTRFFTASNSTFGGGDGVGGGAVLLFLVPRLSFYVIFCFALFSFLSSLSLWLSSLPLMSFYRSCFSSVPRRSRFVLLLVVIFFAILFLVDLVVFPVFPKFLTHFKSHTFKDFGQMHQTREYRWSMTANAMLPARHQSKGSYSEKGILGALLGRPERSTTP